MDAPPTASGTGRAVPTGAAMAPTPRRFTARAGAVGTGLFAGVAAGFLVTDGDLVVLASAVVLVIGALALSAAIVPSDARREVLPLIAFAIGLRVAAAVLLHDGLLAAGRGGFVTGDDAAYADLSSRLAAILHNVPAPFHYASESYLLGTFVYVETAIFYVLGPRVLIVELMNAAMGGVLVAFVYNIARRLFADGRAGMIAALLVSVYPSLVLWSALNLKDSLALLLIAIVLWLVLVFHARGSWWLVPIAFAPLLAIESLRAYIFVGLALVVPASAVLATGRRLRDRITTSALAVGIAALLLAVHVTSVAPALPAGLAGLESERIGMGVGAQSSFAEASVVQVDPGTTYVVTTPTSSASASAGGSPTPTPRVVVVAPGTQLAIVTDPTAPSPSPGVVIVRPGDIVVVGAANATAAAVEQRKPLSITSGTSPVELVSASDNGSSIRTLRYLPRGLAFVLLAPFPWSLSRTLDLLPVPEMLLWYLGLVAAVVTVIRYRRLWRLLAALILFVGGTLLVLALAEGNVGTLYRHRAMVVPFVLILASPTFAYAMARFGGAIKRL